MTVRTHLAITAALLAPATYVTACFAGEFSEHKPVEPDVAEQRTAEPTSTPHTQRKQSAATQSNTELLTEELRDTETRRKDELGSRVSDIEAQAETIRQLTQRQTEYIGKLKAQIDALEAQGAAE